MKDPKSLLLGVDIPEGFSVEVVPEGFAIFRGTERLATITAERRRTLVLTLEYFSKHKPAPL